MYKLGVVVLSILLLFGCTKHEDIKKEPKKVVIVSTKKSIHKRYDALKKKKLDDNEIITLLTSEGYGDDEICKILKPTD